MAPGSEFWALGSREECLSEPDTTLWCPLMRIRRVQANVRQLNSTLPPIDNRPLATSPAYRIVSCVIEWHSGNRVHRVHSPRLPTAMGWERPVVEHIKVLHPTRYWSPSLGYFGLVVRQFSLAAVERRTLDCTQRRVDEGRAFYDSGNHYRNGTGTVRHEPRSAR